MQRSFQDIKDLTLRYFGQEVVEILDKNQLVLWDSDGVFVVKTPKMNLTAYSFKTVGEDMAQRAKRHIATLSRKILGRKDEKEALKKMASYLALRRVHEIKEAHFSDKKP